MIHVYDRSPPPKNSSDNPAMLHQRLNLRAAQDPDTPQSLNSYLILFFFPSPCATSILFSTIHDFVDRPFCLFYDS